MTIPQLHTQRNDGRTTLLDRAQRTLKAPITISGKGIFTGMQAELNLYPADAGSGVKFRRVDLDTAPLIPATLDNYTEATRCTRLEANGASVCTVEHLLSALAAFGIDNVLIEISGPEVPICDGSANRFVDEIRKVGVYEQESLTEVQRLTRPVVFEKGETKLIALPADTYKISYVLHYPNSQLLGSQYFSIEVSPQSYCEEIAPCRTFAPYEEIEPLIEAGLIKGGGLDCAVVIKEDKILNPEGARFHDEMARHKVLDLIGDLSLIGAPFVGHIIAIRSGHATNIAFAKKLFESFNEEESV